MTENEELTEFGFDTDMAKCHVEIAQKRNCISKGGQVLNSEGNRQKLV